MDGRSFAFDRGMRAMQEIDDLTSSRIGGSACGTAKIRRARFECSRAVTLQTSQ
jgi:hypothetical protein